MYVKVLVTEKEKEDLETRTYILENNITTSRVSKTNEHIKKKQQQTNKRETTRITR